MFGENNTICKVYDSCKNIIVDFMACLPSDPLQLPPPSPENITPRNRSLGFAALTLKRMLNILQPRCRDKTHVELPPEFVELLREIDFPAVLMSSVEVNRFLKRFEHINRLFSERYFGKSTSDLGGRQYSDAERDDLYWQCKALVDFSG